MLGIDAQLCYLPGMNFAWIHKDHEIIQAGMIQKSHMQTHNDYFKVDLEEGMQCMLAIASITKLQRKWRESRLRARRLAVGMGMHPRLGRASVLSALDEDTLRIVARYMQDDRKDL